jgi:hypothetical protein
MKTDYTPKNHGIVGKPSDGDKPEKLWFPPELRGGATFGIPWVEACAKYGMHEVLITSEQPFHLGGGVIARRGDKATIPGNVLLEVIGARRGVSTDPRREKETRLRAELEKYDAEKPAFASSRPAKV